MSQIGDWLYNVALIVLVLERTGSGTWIAAAGIVRLLPYVVFGTIGGMIADRWPRRRTMIQSDLIRAGVMFALTIVAARDGSAQVAIVLAGIQLAMQAFTALGCRDVARIDMRMDGDGRPQLLEINTLPGMYHDPLATSYFPVAARAAGWDYDRMVGEVLDRTIARIDRSSERSRTIDLRDAVIRQAPGVG